REGLIAYGDEGNPAGEGVHAVVTTDTGGERVVGGQHDAGIGVAGAERHRALITGVDVTPRTQGRDRDVEGCARDDGRPGRDPDPVGRCAQTTDLGALDLGEPEVPLRAGRYAGGIAVWCGAVELCKEHTIRSDSSDTVSVELGEPEVPIWSRRDANRPAVRGGGRELAHLTIQSHSANPIAIGSGEPNVLVGPHGERKGPAARAERELRDLTSRSNPADFVAAILAEPEIAVRARDDHARVTAGGGNGELR